MTAPTLFATESDCTHTRLHAAARRRAGSGSPDGHTGKARAGNPQHRIRFAVGPCSLGIMLVAQSPLGICAIFFGEDPDALIDHLRTLFPQAEAATADDRFGQLMARVADIVEQPWLEADLPLDMQGTALQKKVWQALQSIAPGTTTSYGEIARRIGAPTAVRAVAQACGANRIAVVIPCHRVVRKDGGLAGYRWGVERKQQLLKREQGRK